MKNRLVGRDLAKAVPLVFMVMVLLSAPVVIGASVGVVAGDWAKYGDITATSTIQGQTLPNWGNFTDFDWMKVTVQSVSGTTVTVQMLAHYNNGTENTQMLSSDVASGSGNLTFFIVPTSLAIGGSIPISFGSIPMIVTDVVTRSYAGADREVYHYGSHTSVSGVTANYDMYWDKAKGVFCEMNLNMSMSILGSATMKTKLTETNMWGTSGGGSLVPGLPDYMLYIIIGVVLVAIAIIVSVATMRRRKAPASKTEPSEQPTPVAESPKT